MWSVVADERVRQPEKKTRLQREQWLNELFKDYLWCDLLFLKKVFKVVARISSYLRNKHNSYVCKYHLCIGALKNSSKPPSTVFFFVFVFFAFCQGHIHQSCTLHKTSSLLRRTTESSNHYDVIAILLLVHYHNNDSLTKSHRHLV